MAEQPRLPSTPQAHSMTLEQYHRYCEQKAGRKMTREEAKFYGLVTEEERRDMAAKYKIPVNPRIAPTAQQHSNMKVWLENFQKRTNKQDQQKTQQPQIEQKKSQPPPQLGEPESELLEEHENTLPKVSGFQKQHMLQKQQRKLEQLRVQKQEKDQEQQRLLKLRIQEQIRIQEQQSTRNQEKNQERQILLKQLRIREQKIAEEQKRVQEQQRALEEQQIVFEKLREAFVEQQKAFVKQLRVQDEQKRVLEEQQRAFVAQKRTEEREKAKEQQKLLEQLRIEEQQRAQEQIRALRAQWAQFLQLEPAQIAKLHYSSPAQTTQLIQLTPAQKIVEWLQLTPAQTTRLLQLQLKLIQPEARTPHMQTQQNGVPSQQNIQMMLQQWINQQGQMMLQILQQEIQQSAKQDISVFKELEEETLAQARLAKQQLTQQESVQSSYANRQNDETPQPVSDAFGNAPQISRSRGRNVGTRGDRQNNDPPTNGDRSRSPHDRAGGLNNDEWRQFKKEVLRNCNQLAMEKMRANCNLF